MAHEGLTSAKTMAAEDPRDQNPLLYEVEKPACLPCFGGPTTVKMCRQAVALVRHADRMDATTDGVPTEEWQNFPERERWPYDCPLTEQGRGRAAGVAQHLGDAAIKAQRPFGLVICSPYLRCAQTAAEIAAHLEVPLTFDRGLGEIFGTNYMPNNTEGTVQHRPMDELAAILEKEYPHVAVVRSKDGALAIRGEEPKWPESFEDAQLRFAARFEVLGMYALSMLTNIVIVTHGDSFVPMLHFLRPEVDVERVPYCGFVVAQRDVVVPRRGEVPTEVYVEEKQPGAAVWATEVGVPHKIRDTQGTMQTRMAREKNRQFEQQHRAKLQSQWSWTGPADDMPIRRSSSVFKGPAGGGGNVVKDVKAMQIATPSGAAGLAPTAGVVLPQPSILAAAKAEAHRDQDGGEKELSPASWDRIAMASKSFSRRSFMFENPD